ncbi:glycosyl transferase, WecB/TagA/CpsF family [Rivularia sp. IAM M-261]|nr:glycosyl transferase, WecB/TagA/CpsF family [Rivularia sp. IAM M-261]
MLKNKRTNSISSPNCELVSIFGTKIYNFSIDDAIKHMMFLIKHDQVVCQSIFIVNTHTINLAESNPYFQEVLNSADAVFADGTGVRWAAKLHGITLKDNLIGTDLIPNFFRESANLGYRYFLLGGQPDIIYQAAKYASSNFTGWEMVGYHHGYFDIDETAKVIEKINSVRPHFLLIGMGNPNQEFWIHKHRSQLKVPVAIGVGGLFHYWAGDLNRSPLFLRLIGMEWLGILFQQPHKWKRYCIGNLQFLLRLAKFARSKSVIGR